MAFPTLWGPAPHTIIATKALGKPLPNGAVVHHVNGDHFDNRNSNLVICQDAAYHMLLHSRTRWIHKRREILAFIDSNQNECV